MLCHVVGIFWCVGCARTEGYYKQSVGEKVQYLQGAYYQQLAAEKAKQLVGLEVIVYYAFKLNVLNFLFLGECGCIVIECCVGLRDISSNLIHRIRYIIAFDFDSQLTVKPHRKYRSATLHYCLRGL